MTAPESIGATTLQIRAALADGDLLYLTDDEQQADALSAALAGLAPEAEVVFVPSSDTLPGDSAPASPANVGRRLAALRRLRRVMGEARRPPLAAIMSGEAAARLYPEPAAFDAAPPILAAGEPIDVTGFAAAMEALGYVCDDRVDEPGEVAVRGDVIDIYPADAGFAARLDIAEGRITGIRWYDPVTQRTLDDCESLEIGRATEPAALPSVPIIAHLPPSRLLMAPKADERRRRFVKLAADAAKSGHKSIDAVDEDAWKDSLAGWEICGKDVSETLPVPRFAERKAPLAALARYAVPLLEAGSRILLVGSERDVRFLRGRVAKAIGSTVDIIADGAAIDAVKPGTAAALVAPVDRGARFGDLVLVAAADLLGSRATSSEKSGLVLARPTNTIGDIGPGDVIVHEDHGVGRVVGLEPDPGASGSEAIALEYAGSGRRLVPTSEAGRIWRYGGDADAVTLDRLNGVGWAKRRAAIDEAIAASASEMLKLADQRRTLEAPVLEPEPAAYERFVATFPFNETPDQFRAIDAVRDDLASGRPMDRLVIGDVGYGKTEVALRAAALAALAGHQVLVVAPTTVLVRQHVQTFARRFAGTGVGVASLSRLSSAAERKAVKAGLADGSVGVVIGTAAVMAKDVTFARLALVIIDEEQRFGAADKTKLRGRPEMHTLAMSATPIPRTLHRALIGLQQVSLINTPPARRQPIRTSLGQLDDAMIRTALLRERARGGQSFVVVPRIEDLAPFADRLRRIVPDLALLQAHGKMPAGDIDTAMVAFADGEGDVLLATNIIEAGLDVPRANTMIVWRADRFGLAQLHQLRGRVGRGNRRGQVFLVTDGEAVAETTLKRLQTLASHDRLGAGFEISAADLDQRGAGDPLSDTQAGHMKLVGVDLYQHLFGASIRAARGEDPGLWFPDVNLGEGGTIPSEWIPDPEIRLGLYMRLARMTDDAELDQFEEELTDRFGAIPPATTQLIGAARLSLLARATGIARIDAGPAAIALTPRDAQRARPVGTDLHPSGDRWLLAERTDDHDRPDRVAALLQSLLQEE